MKKPQTIRNLLVLRHAGAGQGAEVLAYRDRNPLCARCESDPANVLCKPGPTDRKTTKLI